MKRRIVAPALKDEDATLMKHFARRVIISERAIKNAIKEICFGDKLDLISILVKKDE